MSCVKKMISTVLLLVMIVALLPQITLVTHAANYTIKTPSMSTASYFSALPGLYEMGDGYAVIWATTFKGTGYIQYTYQGKTYTVYDEKNGIVRTGDTIHVVKVPYEHLQGNSYTVYSKEVTGHSWATTKYGATASAGPIKVRSYDGGTKDFDFLVLTDVHKQLTWAKNVAQKFKEPDLIIFSGDTVSKLNTKNDIVELFNIMGTVSHGANGQTPLVYIRGNHECRGAYSTALLEYLPTETGEYYFDFTYGPLYSVVLDTSEDKADQHWKTSNNCPRNEYGQLANYYEYNQKQEAWLRSLRKDDSATFRLGIYHIPRVHALTSINDCSYNLAQYTEHLGIQFGIAGHMHLLGAYYDAANQSATKLKHTVFQCGGGDDVAEDQRAAVLVTMNATTKKAYVTAKYSNGTTDSTYNNYAFNFSTHLTDPPAAIEAPDRGLANHFDKSKAYNAGTIRLDTQPAVFESGGDWYNVVWKTSYNSTSSTEEYTAHGATGYVEYTYNGQTYQVFDEVGGTRKTFDDYHTVRIPKEHLNNNTYKVGSFLMLYDYIWKDTNTSQFYLAGNYVESPEYLFEDRSGDRTVNLISCPDMDFQETDASLENVANAVAGLGTSPAYIIMNGNVNWISYDAAALTNLIDAAATVSGSIHPVILSRGHAECRGFVAPNLLKYIPTATGEYYYSVQAGDYTLVNLDTAEDDPDAQIESGKSKYGDRVHLDEKRKEQLAWINSLDAGKLVAISAMPLTNLDSKFGLGYEKALKNKGAVLSIGGHASSFTLNETVDSDSIYTVIPGGNGSGMDVASVLLSGDYAYIRECKYSTSGVITYPTQKAVSLVSGSTQSITASKPPLSGTIYTVSTPGHLKWIADNCTSPSSFSGYTFKLANDIDLMLVPFSPIGGNDDVSSDSDARARGFAGTFDGNGYAIKNLNIYSTNNNVGLFGVLKDGLIKDLTLSGGMVVGGWFTGAIVGYSFGGILEDCYSDVVVYGGYGTDGATKVGGLVGFLSYGSTVNRCANYGTVIGTHPGGNAGGIAGQICSTTTNTISNSYNRGNVLAHGATGFAGGIFGYMGNATLNVTNCYQAASASCPGSQGAIFGGVNASGKLEITNTYFAKGYNGASTGKNGSNNWTSATGSGTITGYEPDTMKTQSFADTLGNQCFTYVKTQNDGFPIHWNAIHHGTGAHVYNPSVTTEPTCTEAGVMVYVCSCGDTYESDAIPPTGHSYKTVISAATCTTDGSRTSTCTKCQDKIVTVVPAPGHDYIWDTCAVCGYVNKDYVQPVYYLFGYVNGANYGCEEDYENLGTYRFVNGQVSAIFTEDSYVAVKTGDNKLWYMTNGWQGNVNAVTLYNAEHIKNADKLYIPANTYVTFTLKENKDGSLSLSYVTEACNHDYVCLSRTDPDCTNDGEATYQCSICKDVRNEILHAPGHSYIWGTCSVCGYVNESYKKSNYYLFGFINGEEHGWGQDHESMGQYPFVNGQLRATFTGETYIGVKSEDNAGWFMTDGWQGTEVTSVILYESTDKANADKLYVPLNQHLVFTLTENPNGTLLLSYEIDETDHSYETEVVPPTCVESGYIVYTCACGDIYLEENAPAIGHDYRVLVTAATCSREGSRTSTCQVCDHVVTKTLSCIPHTYVWDTCTVCGNQNKAYTPPKFYLFGYINGVNYGCEEDYQSMGIYQFVDGRVNAMFTEDSYVGVKTEENGAWYMTDGWQGMETTSVKLHDTRDISAAADKLYVPANTPVTFTLELNQDGTLTLSYDQSACSHDYQYISRTDPSCIVNGTAEYQCTICQERYTQVLTALGHSYEKGSCTLCGMADPDYVSNIAAPNIKLAYPTLSFEDEILMNIYFSVENMEDVLGIGLITYDQKVSQWSVETAKTVIAGYTWSEGDGLYYVTTEGIAAKCLNDTIYFAVYALLSDGSYSYTNLVSYSPRTYAYNQLKNGSMEMKALVVAMLNYGAAAQNYFQYRTDSLVNADLTQEQRSLVSDYSADMIEDVPLPSASKMGEMVGSGGYIKRYPTVSFEGVFCINYYFQPSAQPVGNVTMYVWDQSAYDAAKTLNKNNASKVLTMTITDDDEYLATVDDIVARDLDRGVYVAFCYSDGTTDYCSGVVGYSIGAYCKSQASRTGTMAELAKATAVYGYYAKFLSVLSVGTE